MGPGFLGLQGLGSTQGSDRDRKWGEGWVWDPRTPHSAAGILGTGEEESGQAWEAGSRVSLSPRAPVLEM
jgi:hypothetical protein